MSKEKKDLEEIYDKMFEEVIEHMKDYEPQIVAGTLMAIAMRLYKTHLTEESFKTMLKTVTDAEVKPFSDENETIH